MIRYFLIFTFILVGMYSFACAQGVTLTQFSAMPVNEDVTLTWGLQSEAGVSEYRLYRKAASELEYKYVATVYANGAAEYTYTDRNVFKTTGTTITYQLRVIRNGSPSYFHTSFTHSTSSITRTWGSIKGMFR